MGWFPCSKNSIENKVTQVYLKEKCLINCFMYGTLSVFLSDCNNKFSLQSNKKIALSPRSLIDTTYFIDLKQGNLRYNSRRVYNFFN